MSDNGENIKHVLLAFRKHGQGKVQQKTGPYAKRAKEHPGLPNRKTFRCDTSITLLNFGESELQLVKSWVHLCKKGYVKKEKKIMK